MYILSMILSHAWNDNLPFFLYLKNQINECIIFYLFTFKRYYIMRKSEADGFNGWRCKPITMMHPMFHLIKCLPLLFPNKFMWLHHLRSITVLVTITINVKTIIYSIVWSLSSKIKIYIFFTSWIQAPPCGFNVIHFFLVYCFGSFLYSLIDIVCDALEVLA